MTTCEHCGEEITVSLDHLGRCRDTLSLRLAAAKVACSEALDVLTEYEHCMIDDTDHHECPVCEYGFGSHAKFCSWKIAINKCREALK